MGAAEPGMLDQHLEVFLKESEVIRDMADKGPCVIVGRCAETMFCGTGIPSGCSFTPTLPTGWSAAGKETREQKSLNHDVLRKIITQTDKNRSRYYEFLSGQKWGAKENYDLCINTSSADTEKIIQCVISLL